MENQAEQPLRIIENFNEIKRHAELKWKGVGVCLACDQTATLSGYIYKEQFKWFTISLFTLRTTCLVECGGCGVAWPLPEEAWLRLAAVAQMLAGSEPQ